MSKLDPDTQTSISLIGTAERLFSEKVDREKAIAKVRHLARGRTDLLAKAAGHFLGADTWSSGACHQLLLDAGGEIHPDIVQAAAERTRYNLKNYGHTSAGTQAPSRSLNP